MRVTALALAYPDVGARRGRDADRVRKAVVVQIEAVVMASVQGELVEFGERDHVTTLVNGIRSTRELPQRDRVGFSEPGQYVQVVDCDGQQRGVLVGSEIVEPESPRSA